MQTDKYKRVKGGEKNEKTGQRWTRDEIVEVYFLYKKLNGVGLHEYNPKIQELAYKLGRGVRATENQALMFRNLERSGEYSHGNMNKLTREVWNQYENSSGIEKDEVNNKLTANSVEQEIVKEYTVPKYSYWNKKLIDHFFNEFYSDIEIGCFPVSLDLFQEVTDYEFSYDDFIYSIKRELCSDSFLERLEKLYENSLPRKYQGRHIRKSKPEYFGFIVFLIYALSEYEAENISVSNVYDRINNFGEQVFNKKWSEINSIVAKSLLEPIWESLEDWSCNYLKGNKGLFVKRNHKYSQRKYVSRLERHALFNSKQFRNIIDLLISDGVRPENILRSGDWEVFFRRHKNKISHSDIILDYISDDSPLQLAVIGFLNGYLRKHFTIDIKASEKGSDRVPPIRLKLCFKAIPQWPGDPIEKVYYRASSAEIQVDTLSFREEKFQIVPETNTLSKPISPIIDFEKGAMLYGDSSRYKTSRRMYWLSKSHELNEWIELDFPTNDQVFVIIGPKSIFKSDSIKCNCFEIIDTEYVAARFQNLSQKEFDQIYNLYNPYAKIEGKIELISEFTSNRRRCIYKEFSPKFRYIGSSAEPRIIAISVKNKTELIELNKEEDEEKIYSIPDSFIYDSQFQIKEKGGKIKSSYNFYFGDLNSTPINEKPPILRDYEGVNKVDFNRTKNDILDIPESINRNFDVRIFNKWHSNLYHLFIKGKDLSLKIFDREINCDFKKLGDLLLQFLALNKDITTYDFPKLIRELDPSISIRYSKRIMSHWLNLGYINFQAYGESIKVNPTSILFLQTKVGLKGYLIGYRNSDIITELKKECDRLHIDINFEAHSKYKDSVYPTKIILYDRRGNLDKFFQLKKKLQLYFVNNVRNALNPKYVVYQLACLFTQRSVREFREKVSSEDIYKADHRRKRVYDTDKFSWVDIADDIETFPDGTIVRYDGFTDKSMVHVIRHLGVSRLIGDLSLAVFSTIKNNVLRKKQIAKTDYFNFYVPLYLGLPFWLERGLLLLNGDVPEIENLDGISYRVYNEINIKILQVIENKLEQKIILL